MIFGGVIGGFLLSEFDRSVRFSVESFGDEVTFKGSTESV